MADATTVVEGKVKYRDGRKWKPRWCVLKKPSPVADRLHVVLYKDVHEALRAGGKVKTSFPLDGYCGLDTGLQVDRESHVLAILCHRHVTLFAFQAREDLVQFEIKIRRSLGQDYQFPIRLVKAPGSRLPQEGTKLLIHGLQFCLIAQVPPRILQCWNIADLRRYGALEGKFCFEGGSRCGKGAGVHAVQTDQAEEIAEILRVNSLGKSSTASYRSSQLLDYCLAAPDSPAWKDSHPGSPGSGSGSGSATSPAGDGDGSSMLMCCQVVPHRGDGDMWGCRKRHSVNVTQFHRNSGAAFQKLRQMSVADNECQHLMAVYDVPPKHPRKLESELCSASPESGGCPEGSSATGMSSSSSGMSASSSPRQLKTCQQALLMNAHGAESRVEAGHGLAAVHGRKMRTGSECYTARSLDTTIFDAMVRTQVDTTKRKEALQTLHKQETDLHHEIVLLDKMLQSCHTSSEEDTCPGDRASNEDSRYSEDILHLPEPWMSRTPASVAKKTASLPSQARESKGPVMKVTVVKHLDTFPFTVDQSIRASADMWKPPPSASAYSSDSSVRPPLPYVNLTKYDKKKDTNFAQHRGGDANNRIAAATPKLSTNSTQGDFPQGNLVNLSHVVGSVQNSQSQQSCLLPGMTSAGHGNNDSSSLPQKPLPVPPKNESDEESVDGLSISLERLDDDVMLPPTTVAPPVPYPRLPSTSSTVVPEVKLPLSPCASIPAPSVPPRSAPTTPSEPLYANQPPPLPPPRSKPDIPPPALPPKGPGLLRRNKQRNSGLGSSISNTVPPVPPVRTRSLSVGSQGKSHDFEKQPSIDRSLADRPPMPLPESRRAPVEDMYLPMGSPGSRRCWHSGQTRTEGDSSRPSSLYVTSSPKLRNKGALSAARRGNADVLSGYMDMANMFVEEPKHDLSNSLEDDGQDTGCVGELDTSGSFLDSSAEADTSVDSNYMEMSNFISSCKRKSAVLKNLEALQTFVNATAAGELTPKVRSRPTTPTPPSTVSVPTHETPTVSSKSSCKIYTRISSCSSMSGGKPSPGKHKRHSSSSEDPDHYRPAIPFTNLKNFEQKQTKSSYVNAYIPTAEVPLPEPPKKEEGFFSRLIRRNSKDRSASRSQENLNHPKNRTSVFERTMSVHIQPQGGDEKAISKLKAGRRRSASFPNRLSFQETSGSGETTNNTASKKDAPSSLPPSGKPSPSSKSSLPSPLTKQTEASSQGNSSRPSLGGLFESSSAQNLSDDSEMAPLLQHNSSSSNQSDMRVLTVLHVQQDHSENRAACASLFSDSFLMANLKDMPPSQSTESSISTSDLYKAGVFIPSKTTSLDSSKTDDEKLFDLLESSKRQSLVKNIGEIKAKMSLPLKQLMVSPKEKGETATADGDVDASQLSAHQKPMPLSPVSEVSSLGGLSSTPSPQEHISASHQDDGIYVDMRELLSQSSNTRLPPCAAQRAPCRSPQQHNRHSTAENNIVEDKEDNVPGVRLPPSATLEPPPPLPGLSPKLPPNFITQLSPSLGAQAPCYLSPLLNSVPLVVSIGDIPQEMEEAAAERLSLSSYGSCQSMDCDVVCSSPASTVLRPRWGGEYQVVERRHAGPESVCSTPVTHSPTYTNVFTYEVLSLLRKRSPEITAVSSGENRDREPLPGGTNLTTQLSLTEQVPLSASLVSPDPCASKDPPLPLPPRKGRTCHRTNSEPCSSQTESHVMSHSARLSPPTCPRVPNLLAPEMLEPMLNYAEIDLSAACAVATPPTVKVTRQFSRRQKKPPPRPEPIQYTQIDHTATTALKRAGQEHALSREDYNSLRSGAASVSLARKNSAPVFKERKGSCSVSRDRKWSTCSIESI